MPQMRYFRAHGSGLGPEPTGRWLKTSSEYSTRGIGSGRFEKEGKKTTAEGMTMAKKREADLASGL